MQNTGLLLNNRKQYTIANRMEERKKYTIKMKKSIKSNQEPQLKRTVSRRFFEHKTHEHRL